MSLGLLMAVGALFLAEPPAVKPDDVVVIGSKPNPADVICEKVTLVGSRIATKRVCATRSQWAERRQAERDYIEAIIRSSLLVNDNH